MINSTDLHLRCVLGEEAVSQTAICAHSISTARSAKKNDIHVCVFISLDFGKFCYIGIDQISDKKSRAIYVFEIFKETSHTVYFNGKFVLVSGVRP